MVTEMRDSERDPTRVGAVNASAQYRVAADEKLPSAADDGESDDDVERDVDASSAGDSRASSVGETVSSDASSSTVSSGTVSSKVSSGTASSGTVSSGTV